jgi:hypothetical protein
MVVVAAVVGLAAATLLYAGCGKVKQARQAAQNVREGAEIAKTGKGTITDAQGNKVNVDVSKEKQGEASWSMTDKPGQKTTVTTSATVTEQDLGLKFYPGAEVKSGGTIASSGEKGGKMATAELTTRDSYDKVVKFYKDAYAKGNQVMESPESTLIMVGDTGKSGKMIAISKDAQSGTVKIVLTSGENLK